MLDDPINTTNKYIMMTKYRTDLNIPNIWIKRRFNDHGDIKTLFKWYECGILGCGKNSEPWLDMTRFINWPSNVDNIIEEINQYMANTRPTVGGGNCLLPTHLNGYNFLTHYQFFCEKYIPLDIRNSIRTSHELDRWTALNLSLPIWERTIMLKKQSDPLKYWTGKHDPGSTWQLELPLIKRWITDMENYLFKHIGRVVIYQNKSNHAVPIHRDYPINRYGHSSHFVNIQLTTDNRQAFVYDEITKEKIYTSTKAYIFNESDCHGVDAENQQHFTIRIDGEFHSQVCEQLNFINGKVFDLSYKNGYKFANLKVIDQVDS